MRQVSVGTSIAFGSNSRSIAVGLMACCSSRALASSGTAHRFRQFARLNYRPDPLVPVGIAFVDEVFFGIHGAGWAKQGFDQNRAFLGLAVYAFGALFRTEVGYLNVFLSREPNRLAHVLSLNFFVSFGGR